MAKLSTCCNSALIDKDKLVKKAPTKGSSSFTPIFATFKASILASTSVLQSIYTNVDLQKVNRLALEVFIQNREHS